MDEARRPGPGDSSHRPARQVAAIAAGAGIFLAGAILAGIAYTVLTVSSHGSSAPTVALLLLEVASAAGGAAVGARVARRSGAGASRALSAGVGGPVGLPAVLVLAQQAFSAGAGLAASASSLLLVLAAAAAGAWLAVRESSSRR